MSGIRRAQAVLAGVVALQLIAETALTPYWPMLFRRMFGTDDLALTGSFLMICRVAGLAALPLWGIAAMRWPVRTLLVTGLLGCAVCDLALALAPTWWAFAASSAAVVAFGSVLILAYPELVAVVERRRAGDRRTAVVTFWFVFHVTAVIATLVGGGIVALSEPRWGLGAFAVVDVLLAVLVLIAVPAVPAVPPQRRRTRAAGEHSPVPAAGHPNPSPVERRRDLRPWLLLVLAVVAVDAAIATSRPFLVELLVRQDVDPTVAGWLFLVPALTSLGVLPFARRLLDLLGNRCAPVAAVVAAAGMLVQAGAANAEDPFVMLLGRLLFGAGVGVLLVALDIAVFDRIGTTGAAFSAVETGRSAALLAAPLLATVAAIAWLGAPLLLAAALLGGAALLLTGRRPAGAEARPDLLEAENVVDPVH